ncbi:polysaccharide deacetylase family protein [Algoriphagus resistens]|uniref:polysaccharide deacetylase family protein n=1 Tax=Algoriphagus resistens TaxID=1750590 RepID=UPI0007169561|nr:polysaccharide deacetylase family protein [Algoriphagus resistens]
MNRIIVLGIFIFLGYGAFGQQKSISITIDDVPNTLKFHDDGFRSVLLERLDSVDIPFTIFINESRIFQNEIAEKNKMLLVRWIAHRNSSIGNHGFSHLRYSEVGFDRFVEDVQKGSVLSDSIASHYGKSIGSFRFPFNDLGKDSTQQVQIKEYLKASDGQIAPFTVESSDWMFDSVYCYYLEKEEYEKAKELGELYVAKTMELLSFFEGMAEEIYGRPISQIYLCHDNGINADYLPELVSALRNEGYEIVGFEDSMKDPVYSQDDKYNQKWGVSWLYRWMQTQEERVQWMKQEPDLTEIQQLFEKVSDSGNLSDKLN